jgi:hypothetical protein
MEEAGHGYLCPIGHTGIAELDDVDAGAIAELISHHLSTFGRSDVRVFGGSADADGLAVIVGCGGRELRGRRAFRSAAARGQSERGRYDPDVRLESWG